MRNLVIVGEGPNPSTVRLERIHPLFGNPSRVLTKAAGWAKDISTEKGYYKQLYRRARLYNVCQHEFDPQEARETAARLLRLYPHGKFVLLGRKVSRAFEHEQNWYEVVSRGEQLLVAVPHPSGLNREWNDPETHERAGETLRRMYAASLHAWPDGRWSPG